MHRGFQVDNISDFILVACSMGLTSNDRGEPIINCPCIVFCIFMVFVTDGIQFEHPIQVFIFRNSLYILLNLSTERACVFRRS